MNVTIFIVSCKKHFQYLKYCLRSIDKFAKGFRNTVLMVPRTEVDDLYRMTDVNEFKSALNIVPFDEWPNKGMLHHEYLEMTAPLYCPLTDAILHFDSDMVFTEPVTPDDFIENGKPVLMHATFKWLIAQQANLECWKRAVEKAVGGKCEREMMRRPGLIYVVETYQKSKEMVEAHTKMDMGEYVRSCENAFPQTFAEYPTLGWVAWLTHPDKYKWIDQEKEPFPPMKIRQMWSHRDPTAEDIQTFKQLGLEP